MTIISIINRKNTRDEISSAEIILSCLAGFFLFAFLCIFLYNKLILYEGNSLRLIHLKEEFTIGEVLTFLSLLGSALAFIVGWLHNERQKREQEAKSHLEKLEASKKEYLTRQQIYQKEYADKIRNSATEIMAKLNRWRDLNLLFMEEIQPIIEETDHILVKENKTEAAKSYLWKGIIDSRLIAHKRINEEEIEIAYKDLYGYEPEIERNFETVLQKYKYLDKRIFQMLQIITQNDIDRTKEPFKRNDLGNRLGNSLGLTRFLYECLAEDITLPFRDDIIKLIKSTDETIYIKKIRTRKLDELFGFEEGFFWALNGLNFCFLKDYKEALNCFNKALRWAPNRYGYLAGRSLVHQALNMTEAAQRDRDQALSLVPGSPLKNDSNYSMLQAKEDIYLYDFSAWRSKIYV